VIEAVSVILQVGYFKISGGKRIFRVAPLHHISTWAAGPRPRRSRDSGSWRWSLPELPWRQ